MSDFEPRKRPPTTNEPPRPPRGLVEALDLGEVVLFGGSGLSAQAGLPTWTHLIDAMLLTLAEAEPGGDWQRLRREVVRGDPTLAAELLRNRLTQPQLRDLVETLRGEEPRQLPPVLRAVGQLPLAGALTFNYDALLERALASRKPRVLLPDDSDLLPRLLRDARPFVLKLHGDLRSEEVLFVADDFKRSLRERPVLARSLSGLLETRTLLFLGASVRAIDQFFDAVDPWSRPQREHFALVPWQEDLVLHQERLAKKSGVSLLPFVDSDFRSLRIFVDSLTRRIANLGVRGRPQPIVPPAQELQPLRRVTLTEIGPFKRLSVELAPDRAVLLGENATGKSSFLRAIALGLCGDWPGTDAGARRLLRSGARRGSIELEFERSMFRSALVRDGSRVRVEPESVTPLQAGAWLTLGFPALRSVAVGRPDNGGPGTREPDPTPDDALPLAVANADVRISDLEQWIINTSAATAKGGARAQTGRRRLEAFFDVLRTLNPGVPFSFSGVDPDTFQVELETSDGTIGLGMLSQGMTDVIGWAGVLLQRLYEINPAAPRPQEHPALVLVDELDAHLHPEWQRKVLPALRNAFPNIQLIATTHSPLVAGSAEPGELIHLRRDENGVRAERLIEDFGGWRSDQILTSRAFDLPTSRDMATERLLARHTELLEGSNTVARHDAEAIAEQLRNRLPGPEETELAREASELVRRALADEVRELPSEQLGALIAEAQLYLAQLRRSR
jgi:hypothetical protein